MFWSNARTSALSWNWSIAVTWSISRKKGRHNAQFPILDEKGKLLVDAQKEPTIFLKCKWKLQANDISFVEMTKGIIRVKEIFVQPPLLRQSYNTCWSQRLIRNVQWQLPLKGMNAIWNLQLLQFLFYFTFASNLGSIFLQLFSKRHYSNETFVCSKWQKWTKFLFIPEKLLIKCNIDLYHWISNKACTAPLDR